MNSTFRPNAGFMAQLEVFHAAHFQLTRRNKETRAFYVQRAAKEVMSKSVFHMLHGSRLEHCPDGDGSELQMDMFAKYPRTPSDSTPSTPYPQARRRIRCKMCRQELATREHMVDHGQVGPSTPSTGNILTPAISRRPSAGGETIVISARESASGEQSSVTLIRRPSASSGTVRRPSLGGGLSTMTPIHADPLSNNETAITERERRPSGSETVPRRSFGAGGAFGGLSMTPMSVNSAEPSILKRPRRTSLLGLGDGSNEQTVGMSVSALESDESDKEDDGVKAYFGGTATTTVASTTTTTTTSISTAVVKTPLSSPQELAAQIHPALAALRSSQLISELSSSNSLSMKPLKEPSSGGTYRKLSISNISPPLLMPNVNCSGYFLEPVSSTHSFPLRQATDGIVDEMDGLFLGIREYGWQNSLSQQKVWC